MTGRILVACVGNVLRRDDGFGPAVAERLADLPPGATETLEITFTTPAPAGTLELACYVPGHYEAGMHLPIAVVP